MTIRSVKWRGRLRRSVLVAVLIALLPLPSVAAERRPADAGPIRTSIKKIPVAVSTAVPATATHASRRSQQSGPERDSSFFKSKTGLVALAVLAGGVGYALYSTRNDRITSPGKE